MANLHRSPSVPFVRAAVAVVGGGEVPASAGAVGHGTVRRGAARVEQGVHLRGALPGVERRALDPRHVAAGVHNDGLPDGGRAQAHGDDVLERVHGVADVARDHHLLVVSRACRAPGCGGASPGRMACQ